MSSSSPTELLHDFVTKQKGLLQLELREEEDRSAAPTQEDDKERRAGQSLHNLRITEVSIGLYGRTVLTLQSRCAAAAQKAVMEEGDEKKRGDREVARLPAHKFTVGDEVEIAGRTSRRTSQEDGGRKPITGVVSKVTECEISIAVSSSGGNTAAGTAGGRSSKPSSAGKKNKTSSQSAQDSTDDSFDFFTSDDGPLSIIARSSGQVHRKMMVALDTLQKNGVHHPLAGHIVRKMFTSSDGNDQQQGQRQKLDAAGSEGQQQQQPFNKTLDESQLEAVRFALASDDVALIHGPPGTGKTTAVVELIRQAVYHKHWKVLVCAPSNVAVDNVLERLVQKAPSPPPDAGGGARQQRQAKAAAGTSTITNKVPRVVRLGHPARLQPAVLRHSLEALVKSADGTEIVQDCRRELRDYVNILTWSSSEANGGAKKKSKKPTYADRKKAKSEIRHLRKEVRTREEQVVRDILQTRNVVLATNVGASARVLDGIEFDLVVIDEAAQALEVSCWIPILRGRRLVLAGDHRQLPPTIKSRAAVGMGLGVTMFDRAINMYGSGQISRMLTVQYRMHKDISDWASEAMYDGKLKPADTVATRRLCQLPHVTETCDETKPTLLLIDSAGCDMEEEVTGAGSKFNRGEAQVVKVHVEKLLATGLRQDELAIITPYNGQVEVLRNLLLPAHPNLEIRSVDGFQGGEREAVVLSLVRSSRNGGIGFLADERRLNVAVTRARRHCAVVCDTETVSKNDFLKGLVSWMEHRGEYRSALEFTGSDPDAKPASVSEESVARMKDEIRSHEGGTAETIIEAKPDGGSPSTPKKFDRAEASVAPGGRGSQGKKVHTDYEKRAMRDVLMDQIGTFSENGEKGGELRLSESLSKFERLIAHELAEELGLGHRSEGIDGKDRQIVLSILKERKRPTSVKPQKHQTDEREGMGNDEVSSAAVSAFSKLDIGSDDSESETDEKDYQKGQKSASRDDLPPNRLLSDLAIERMERQQQKQEQQQASAKDVQKSNEQKRGKKKEKKKPKGQRLGGGQSDSKSKDKVDDEMGDLDDMDYLDAQIEKVQTSHGRKVEGTGSNYRSVINGILISKPRPQEKKRDARASSALKDKLRKAEEGRKAKGGKKKK